MLFLKAGSEKAGPESFARRSPMRFHRIRASTPSILRACGALLAMAAMLFASGCSGRADKASGTSPEAGSAAAEAGRAGGRETSAGPDSFPYVPEIADTARTEILVLGTPHLRELPPFPLSSLGPLLEVLENWGPEVIAIEALPADVLDDMDARGGLWAEVVREFAGPRLDMGRSLQRRLGITRAEAEARAEAILARRQPLDARARLDLAFYFTAAYDQASALVHWASLGPGDRAAQTLLPLEAAERLNAALEAPREDLSVGVELARRLGLDRVHAVDSHEDARVFIALNERMPEALEAIGVHPESTSAARKAFYEDARQRLEAATADGAALLDHYAFVNSPEFAARDISFQWGSYLRMGLASGADRARLAQWESRNLAIATNVRRVTALHPGQRALVIIGTAHKPFLERYLDRMMDVRIVPFAALLN